MGGLLYEAEAYGIDACSIAAFDRAARDDRFAVPYEQAQVTGSVEFENAREENIGTEGSDIIGPFEPHGFWEMTEGTVTVTPGHNGNGLLFTPNYSNEQS